MIAELIREIFHFSFSISHFSLPLEANGILVMTNEKWKMRNGKSVANLLNGRLGEIGQAGMPILLTSRTYLSPLVPQNSATVCGGARLEPFARLNSFWAARITMH